MQGKIQFLLALLAVSGMVQAATARHWFGFGADSRLTGLQEQLRQSQLRRLRVVDNTPEEAAPEFAGLGYGYGESHGYGYGGYGESQGAGRSLLAPAVAYSTERANVQSRIQAGAAWNPSAASIELQEAGQRAQQFYEEGDEVVTAPVREAGQRAQQFYEEGDEVVTAPVREAGQRAQQFYEEGDEILVGPVPNL